MEAKQRRLILVLVMAGTLGVGASARGQLTAWWKFDETAGTVATDSVNGYDGLFYGTGTPPAWIDDPQRGRVIKLAGGTGINEVSGGGVVNFGDDPIFNLDSGVFSVALWVKIPGYQRSWEYILSRDTPANNDWRIGRFSSSSTQLRWTGGQNSQALYTKSGVDMDDGNWHHLAWTYDGEYYRLYRDGYLDASGYDLDNPRTRTVDMVLGGRGSANQMMAYVDDLFIAVGSVLTDQDVLELWEGIIGPPIINFPPKVEAGPGYCCVIEPVSGPITVELSGTVEDTTVFVPNELSYQWRQLRG